MSAELPRAVQVPSGRVVHLDAKRTAKKKRAHVAGEPLFAEAIDAFESGDVAMRADGVPITVYALDLRDFHALRAILTHAGLLAEEEVEIRCRNCDAEIHHAPCAAMPLGPFVDRELRDPELDETLDLGAAHEIPEVPLGRRRSARTVTLSPVTVDDAAPLFRALARPTLSFTGDVVRAMGILELGAEKNPARIARALSSATDEAWGRITELYLAAHYPPRLFSIALCPKCGARNDVDAPYEREFEPGVPESRPPEESHDELPAFEAFAERGRALSGELFAEEGVEGISFVVEGGVPAVDDGGEPLMGAYVPGTPGDMGAPSRAPEITVYYRTFRAIWDEDGPFDWDAELAETIAHELEHHLGYLAGDDPMDDDERAEIEGEAMRVLGKRAVVREGVRTLGHDAKDFFVRTWPVWLLIAIATVIATMTR
jgi:Zincin-like metallopeptidase